MIKITVAAIVAFGLQSGLSLIFGCDLLSFFQMMTFLLNSCSEFWKWLFPLKLTPVTKCVLFYFHSIKRDPFMFNSYHYFCDIKRLKFQNGVTTNFRGRWRPFCDSNKNIINANCLSFEDSFLASKKDSQGVYREYKQQYKNELTPSLVLAYFHIVVYIYLRISLLLSCKVNESRTSLFYRRCYLWTYRRKDGLGCFWWIHLEKPITEKEVPTSYSFLCSYL